MPQESRPALRPPPCAAGWGVRQACADFWLSAFFWSSAHQPWLVRAARRPATWAAARCSQAIRCSTAANGQRIFRHELSEQEQRQFALQVATSFYDFIADIGRALGRSRDQLLNNIEAIDGQEHYRAARQLKRGAVVVTAHMGSFEAGMVAIVPQEKRVHVVFRRDANSLFERTRQRLREQLGVVEAPLGEGPETWFGLREALLADEVVVVQGDRVMPGQKGQRVPFLGGHLLLPTGPAKLALSSGSPMLPILTGRAEDGRIRIAIEEPIQLDPALGAAEAVSTAVLRWAAVLEQHVQRCPHQWLLLCPAFCEDADPRAEENG